MRTMVAPKEPLARPIKIHSAPSLVWRIHNAHSLPRMPNCFPAQYVLFYFMPTAVHFFRYRIVNRFFWHPEKLRPKFCVMPPKPRDGRGREGGGGNYGNMFWQL